MVEEVWGTGVRARAEEGIVKREELKSCLEILMGDGERGKEIRSNVKNYRGLAMDAVKVGGSSNNNLIKFEQLVAFKLRLDKVKKEAKRDMFAEQLKFGSNVVIDQDKEEKTSHLGVICLIKLKIIGSGWTRKMRVRLFMYHLGA
ncbi:hypothetical protein RND71_028523 [Anisodus tanguticus]|uniref:Uncharacterized protein n=1 Tax=Anisodus tanguticus TaxID=243964 RepID=A0AAE1VA45_9SOLA|nr:hypothetical protein RND71_028523 [Anisodus tanguticus]